ncbi:MAG: glycosyltransferase family 1 protein [Rickettsiales bacterium TMED289]|nr:MAG: glycosyltransferase family 1 protein [Rickettsiales bacterium TMED289]|tara:strand:- start:1698 stop:2780 length:1083 start_codon:yes stop_codon:yes gene_type:complete
MNLIITRSFPPSIGGMQNLMWGLANAISKIDLTKVFADYEENHLNIDNQVSFSIERVGGAKIFRKYRKAYLINEYIKSNKNIKNIIVDHWKSLELIKTNINKICLIHAKEINHDSGTKLNKRVLNVLNNVKTIVSNSEFTKNLAIEKGVNPNLITVIHPGVDPIKEIDEKYLKKSKEILINKSPRLITVSRFDRRKNHEKVLMAVRNLKQIYPQIIYTCIGYGKEEERLKKLTRELVLENQVLFLNNVSEGLKNALISSSDIFVMPSIKYKKSIEGFGITFIEAAQHGLPSIGGKDGGAADAIQHEKTGLICDGSSLEDIYSSINKLLENKNYKRFGDFAKEASKKFLWSNMIEKYKRIL